MKLQLPLIATAVDGKNVIADRSGQRIFTADVNDIRMCFAVVDIINAMPGIERELQFLIDAAKRASLAIQDLDATEIPPRSH